MKNIFLLVLVIAFSACAAFDSDSKTIQGFDETGKPTISPEANKYEGFYSGKATQVSNSCTAADLSSLDGDLQVDVVQSGDVVSTMFADGKTADANLEDGKKVTVKVERQGPADQAITWLYTFNFDEAKATGNIEVVESTTEGQLDAACASYSFELTKQKEKPEGFGQGNQSEEAAPAQ